MEELREIVMNKGEFSAGMLVQALGGSQVMTLGGSPDAWVCTWAENGLGRLKTYEPEELVPADTQLNQKQ